MAWEKSKGRWDDVNRHLPKDWAKIREAVFQRDGYRCTQALPRTGKRCPNHRGDAKGTQLQCDHLGSKWHHSMDNLTTLCKFHHDKKTSDQGVAAREKRKNPPSKAARGRRVEQHPGLKRRRQEGQP